MAVSASGKAAYKRMVFVLYRQRSLLHKKFNDFPELSFNSIIIFKSHVILFELPGNKDFSRVEILKKLISILKRFSVSAVSVFLNSLGSFFTGYLYFKRYAAIKDYLRIENIHSLTCSQTKSRQNIICFFFRSSGILTCKVAFFIKYLQILLM